MTTEDDHVLGAAATELLGGLATLGWSQAELARVMGVDPNTVSRWLTGKVQPQFMAVAFMRLLVKVHDTADSVTP